MGNEQTRIIVGAGFLSVVVLTVLFVSCCSSRWKTKPLEPNERAIERADEAVVHRSLFGLTTVRAFFTSWRSSSSLRNSNASNYARQVSPGAITSAEFRLAPMAEIQGESSTSVANSNTNDLV